MSLSEKLILSGNLTFVGVSVVFLILVLLILLIQAFKPLTRLLAHRQTGSPISSKQPTVHRHAPDADAAIVPETIPPEHVAAIAAAVAIICEKEGRTSELVIRSIRHSKPTSPSWNLEGRRARLHRHS